MSWYASGSLAVSQPENHQDIRYMAQTLFQ